MKDFSNNKEKQKNYIIAEIAQGYEGDIGLCKRYIKLAKRAGADGVKFQIVFASDLCTSTYVHHNLFKTLEMPFSEWQSLVGYSKEVGIDLWYDIFGVNSFNQLKNSNVAGFKIHCSDIKNYPFLRELSSYNGKIILAVGGSTLEEIEVAYNILKNADITLMSGFQAEPNLCIDVELEKLAILKNKFKCDIGYADHIDVNKPLALALPAMALLKGANVIEKHLTIERDGLELEDYVSALNYNEFKKMVELVRDVENFSNIGEHGNGYTLGERETQYRKNTKKALLAKHHLKKGDIIKDQDIVFLRTGEKVDEIMDIDQLIGKKVKKDIDSLSVIRKEYLE